MNKDIPYAFFFCALSLLYPVFCQAQSECPIRNVDGRMTIQVEGGLELALDGKNGSATELTLGGQAFPLGGAPLLSFEEVAEDLDAPNLLDGELAKSWGMPEESIAENANSQEGTWLAVSGEEGSPRPARTVVLNQPEPQPMILSGWCQADAEGAALGWLSRHLALNANGVYVGGEALPERSAVFGQYDHGPQFNRVAVCPDRPLEKLNLDLSVISGATKAWYKDVELRQAQYRRYAPSEPLEHIDNSVLQEFRSEDAKLYGLVQYTPERDHVIVKCRWQSLVPEDRALSAYFTIPFDAVGGVWHDHFRGQRRIEAGKLYRDSVKYGAGRDGYNSRYPLACVETANGAGLAIATTLDEPRVFQLEYDAQTRAFRIRFDIGMSPDAGTWANRGSFTAYLFRYDTRDGFRGATEQYQRLFPWAFERRVQRQGIWLAFISPPTVPGDWRPFGYQFIEAVSNMGWTAREGMYSLRYVEPWLHHHEFPENVDAPEVHGPALPEASITLSQRVAQQKNLPLDMRRRCASYEGAYIENAWGQPDGYLFRSPEGGRNENMMIVNPNGRLPVPEGALYTISDWDRAVIDETRTVKDQWYIDGWTAIRTAAHPFLAIDAEQKTEGKQSLRLDPIQGGSYFEQYLRGISQVLYLEKPTDSPMTFSMDARAVNLPEAGVLYNCSLKFFYASGKSSSTPLPLDTLSGEWKSFSVAATPEEPAIAVLITVRQPAWTPDNSTLWLDDFKLTLKDGSVNLLKNGGFEQAELLPCKMDGVYLDTIECYEANLNYRRSHWAFTEEPLVFDSARRPALHQIFSHATFVRQLAQKLHPDGLILFGNCTPVTPFVAPYLDALGTELFWKSEDKWQPWEDDKFNYVHFMTGNKPYGMLQYSNLSAEEEARYVKRCLFYGMFPSNQAAPDGSWYWSDPVVVARHRPVFAQYIPIIKEVAEAGWRPMTLAASDNGQIWLERYGEGETSYITVFNPGTERAGALITMDDRAGISKDAALHDIVNNTDIAWDGASNAPSFRIELEPEDVAVVRISAAKR